MGVVLYAPALALNAGENGAHLVYILEKMSAFGNACCNA